MLYGLNRGETGCENITDMSVACVAKQVFRCVLKRAIRGVSTPHQLRDLTCSHARARVLSKCRRDFHATSSAMVAKIMTPDEMFSRKSLQDYLRTLETEFNECLRAVNNANLQAGDEEEVRAKRTRGTRGTALGPLVQKIRELESKQRDFEETESLLKGSYGISV